LGGRALVARFLLDEVPPECDPLGPYNKLIWAPGLLVGHMLSSWTASPSAARAR
jgi:aldehyde:ferredoxin oxidoreductase